MSSDRGTNPARRHQIPRVHSMGRDGDSARAVLRSLSADKQVEFLLTVVDALPDTVLAHRPDGAMLYYSPSACDLLGYEPSEMDNLSPYGWVGTAHIHGAAVRIERILHEGRLAFDSSIRRKDGISIPARVHAQKVDTAVGPVIVSVIRDMREHGDARLVADEHESELAT